MQLAGNKNNNNLSGSCNLQDTTLDYRGSIKTTQITGHQIHRSINVKV